MPYQITEPHPTAPPNTYHHTGRGGAGNMYKVSSTSPAKSSSSSKSANLARTTTASTSSRLSSTHPSSKVSTGRGGAANIRASADIRNFSFEDEVALQARERNHDVWHVGRGGAGNWGSSAGKTAVPRKMSQESDGSSVRSGFFGRLSGAFDRN